MYRCCQSIYAYLGAGLTIAVVAILLITGTAATRQNEQSLQTQHVIAGHETDDAYDQLGGKLTQMVFWQDAFDNVARRWNQKWVDYQFGPYLESTGIHHTAIYGPNATLRFVWDHERHDQNRPAEVSRASLAKAQGLTALLKSVRVPSAHRPPKVQEGIVTVAGVPYFAVAAAVTPENGADFPIAQEWQYTVLFLAPATVANFQALSGGFGARNLRIVRDGNAPEGYATYPLGDAAGHPLAWLEWAPQRPGADFLRAIIPASLVVFLLLGLLQAGIVRRWQVLQRDLFTAEAKAVAAQAESRTKSVFLGTISHELRTPLNAIIGFSDVLLHRLFGPLGSTRYEEYAGYIKTSGTALLKIVNDLIEIARIEARDTAIEKQHLDAAYAARLAVEGASERAAAKNVTLILDAVDGSAWCEGSPLSFCQAIERVLDNAIRHSREGSTVTVSALRLEHDAVVEVRDTGDGIPPERLADLGKPFGHSESHLVTGNGGAGLGLSISMGLMRVMGGSLSIESEVGVGTTVRLRLPGAEAQSSDTKMAA